VRLPRPVGGSAAPSVVFGILLALGPWALVGCGRAVQVTPAATADSPGCQGLRDAWPSTVGGQTRVPTSSDSPTLAAWGDPAIIARCGVSEPGPTTEDCISASGIDWVARRLDDGMAFTTYGRSPAIEVLVPATYAPEPLVLGAFAQVAGTIAQGGHRCS
jgi:uncharacterized protein DUF3515